MTAKEKVFLALILNVIYMHHDGVQGSPFICHIIAGASIAVFIGSLSMFIHWLE